MTIQEKYSYISGILDGEGSFYIQKSIRKNKKLEYRATIKIGINDKIGLKILQEIFGGIIHIGTAKINKETGESYSPPWVLSYSSTDKVKEIIEKLLPYLQIKKDQGELLLEFIEFKKQSAGLSRFRRNGILNNYYIKCKKLKQKNWIINQ